MRFDCPGIFYWYVICQSTLNSLSYSFLSGHVICLDLRPKSYCFVPNPSSSTKILKFPITNTKFAFVLQ